ncbi:hypothetical protein RO3G_10936 [Rhizopus delemar RA 99-880]|uniref:Uncharacterized protein n=1 Tax=Rhizopus delemar (strain RA 99-880 / ATCC MYA-4621 / FGSC 9543 / NRRL 43880) TaxID=246409 RepID=I1CCP5_RHIO9|nr:hypothetical protein RO3G_10936 [Rhizopus delemar RA 99-880]|eukprot:EIE86225.1 hypothetical protein RO3G_10936 [Rhizopus delemar RA 99-880]
MGGSCLLPGVNSNWPTTQEDEKINYHIVTKQLKIAERHFYTLLKSFPTNRKR